jgi:hypothetical protein
MCLKFLRYGRSKNRPRVDGRRGLARLWRRAERAGKSGDRETDQWLGEKGRERAQREGRAETQRQNNGWLRRYIIS